MTPYRAVVVADPGELGRVRSGLRDWLHDEHADETAIQELVLVVNEVVTNAIDHANVTDFITVRCRRDGSRVTIEVADKGRWKEPDQLADSELHGRGLQIVETLAESLVIHAEPSGTTVSVTYCL